jgi:5-methyltetrahydropteroyltriglutamate--homocysteine methyltransferase
MQTMKKTSPETYSKMPPFRAEQVGSLLRPEFILNARTAFSNGTIDANTLRDIENKAITEAVKKQESLGFESVTDGELRRAYFHLDFLEQIDGISITGNIAASSDAGEKVDFTPPKLTVPGKLHHNRNIQVDDFNFLNAATSKTAKVSIPSPSMVHFRGGRDAIDQTIYPDLDEFFQDLALVFRTEIEALYTAGCRYIQFDDTNLAYLCDPVMCEDARKRGEDTSKLPSIYAELINASIPKGLEDLCVGIHLCRGNFRSTWFSSGSYDAVAEVLFNEMNVDTYFLEYDDERSGGFDPLRFVPADKSIVLGLVSSKLAAIEEKQEIIDRINEASQFIPLDNLCLSPQCGFASTHHGNNLSEDQQWAKLALVKEIADEIWK